jgi:hypothetical protein
VLAFRYASAGGSWVAGRRSANSFGIILTGRGAGRRLSGDASPRYLFAVLLPEIAGVGVRRALELGETQRGELVLAVLRVLSEIGEERLAA